MSDSVRQRPRFRPAKPLAAIGVVLALIVAVWVISEVLEGPIGPEATCINKGVPYAVTYPEGWFLHPPDPTIRAGACTHFGPEPFAPDAQVAGGGASVWLNYLNGSCLAFSTGVPPFDELVIAGMPALRFESTLLDDTHTYTYMVDLNPPHLAAGGAGVQPDCDQARGLTLHTREGVPGDFDVNRAVVDRMAETLRVGD